MSDPNKAAGFIPIETSEKPSLGEAVPNDLYVHLPKSNRYICYILKGEVWSERKEEMLAKHADQKLYSRDRGESPDEAPNENENGKPSQEPSQDPSIQMPADLSDSTASKIFEGDEIEADKKKLIKGDLPDKTPPDKPVYLTEAEATIDKPTVEDLNEVVTRELKELFRFMADPEIKDPSTTLDCLQNASSEILSKVAPEVENLRDVLLKNSKYLLVMNDSAAITSISIFIAMSHGFTSRKVFQDLSMAILFMDAPLAEQENADILQYYQDPTALDPNVIKKIKQHPKQAHITVRDRMQSVSENILQLILSHHELYNGEGYPHGIRSESLSTLSRSLSLSVNIFEIMKREHLKGKEIEILDALRELEELDQEPHARRHHRRLVKDSIHFLIKPDSEKPTSSQAED